MLITYSEDGKIFEAFRLEPEDVSKSFPKEPGKLQSVLRFVLHGWIASLDTDDPIPLMDRFEDSGEIR